MLHYRTCNICEAMCGVVVEHDGQHVTSIRGDERDRYSNGYICPKATGLQDLHEDPDRLRTPQRRIGDRWEPCDWDTAIGTAAERLAAIQRNYGKDAVAVYVGNPTAHNFGATLFGLPFLGAVGTKNRFSATSTDQLPHMLAALFMFGHQLLMPVPDVDRCDHLFILGGNPLVSGGSLMGAPDAKTKLKRLRARGGRLIVVDPRRTETAALADEHVFIRPGGDALLLAAMIRTLFAESRVDLRHLTSFTDGVTELERLVAPYTPERVAPATGIPADTIARLARDFAAARRGACYGRVGTCQNQFGGLAGWLINALNVVTGNLDREGGMMLTTPAVDIVAITALAGQRGSYGAYKSRVRGLPEFGGELPAATLAEEIDTPGDGQMRS
jgi:anaerobic selenocysteine-containing dehydrogenase